MTAPPSEALARRVYAYFIFRLRQPADAERLTRETFQRVAEERNRRPAAAGEPDLPVFGVARAVIADNPRRRGATRVDATPSGAEGEATGISNELAVAIGRLHGRERDALALRFGARLPIGDIAELLDRTPADVKQRLARGTRMLLQLGVLPKEEGKRASAEGAGARRPEKAEPEKNEPDR
jgi:DNA-directed RNA polymerase specialized sigma24 family protein